MTFEDTKLTPEHFAPAPAPVVPAAQPQPAAPAPAATATAAGASAPSSQGALIARLKQLKELFNAELITEEEYTAKKKEILDKL